MKLLHFLLFIALLSVITAKGKNKDKHKGKGKEKDKHIAAASGDAGFYYDVNGGGTCGAACGIKSFAKTKHIPMCEGRNPNPRRLIDYSTNKIVAIPARLFKKHRDLMCGKRIIVSICGKERDDLNLVVWDGFHDDGDSGLRFSSTMFAELFGKDRCEEKIISGELSWKIVDEQIIRYNKKKHGGAICLIKPLDDTPDIPYDDNVIVPGFNDVSQEDQTKSFPGLDYCGTVGPEDLPIDTPFDDDVIVPGFTDVNTNQQEDVVHSPFADNVIVPGLENFTGNQKGNKGNK